MKTRFILAAVAALASLATAHQFWIQPSRFNLQKGEAVGVRLLVGDGFPGEVRPRDPTKLDEFVILNTTSRKDIRGVDGEDPAGWARVEQDGTHVLGYRSKGTLLELGAEKFEEYLILEGLDQVVEARREAGETSKPARESYSRAAKCLVNVGGVRDDGFRKSLGYPVEITPLTDPCFASSESPIVFEVVSDGKPMAGAAVFAFTSEDINYKLGGKTDQEGKVTFTFDRPGIWMISTIQMKRAPEGSGTDWQSVWASLTFELRGSTQSR